MFQEQFGDKIQHSTIQVIVLHGPEMLYHDFSIAAAAQ